MNANLELAAIQAVFHRQLNMDRAIRHVITETGASEADAQKAVRQVMVSYKQAA